MIFDLYFGFLLFPPVSSPDDPVCGRLGRTMQYFSARPDENFIISGFLNVNGGSSSGIPSNLGILDQIAALHWIQENIEDFGGR